MLAKGAPEPSGLYLINDINTVDCIYFVVCPLWYFIIFLYMITVSAYVNSVRVTHLLWTKLQTTILTYWGRDTMATLSQTAQWNAFSWMKMFKFGLKFHWNRFLELNWQQVSIGSDNGVASYRWQAIIWTNDGLVYWRIYVHPASISYVHFLQRWLVSFDSFSLKSVGIGEMRS